VNGGGDVCATVTSTDPAVEAAFAYCVDLGGAGICVGICDGRLLGDGTGPDRNCGEGYACLPLDEPFFGIQLPGLDCSLEACPEGYECLDLSDGSKGCFQAENACQQVATDGTVDVSSISVNGPDGADVSVDVGSTVQLGATVLPADASNPALTWSSSDTSVATVDDNGLVTGVAAGTATITAAATDGSGQSGAIDVSVAEEEPEPEPTTYTVVSVNGSLDFTPEDLVIAVGDTVRFEMSSSHNAVEVSQATYESGGLTPLDGGFNIGFGQTGEVVFSEVGVHYFVCQPHAGRGMVGTIRVE